MSAFTRIQCSDCGGLFVRMAGTATDHFVCVECGHEVTRRDIRLDEGESLEIRDGFLGYTTEEVAEED